MLKTVLLCALLFTSASFPAQAAFVDSTRVDLGAATPFELASLSPQGPWSIESSVTFPMVRIYMAKLSYRASVQSSLGVGFAFQNWRNVDAAPLGQSNAWTLLLAYRHYVWRNLHIEGELWPAYNRFESYVDDRTYSGLELWVEYRVGYAFDIGPRLQLNLQPGIGHGVWQQTRWPDLEYESTRELISTSLIFVPQVLLGWRF